MAFYCLILTDSRVPPYNLLLGSCQCLTCATKIISFDIFHQVFFARHHCLKAKGDAPSFSGVLMQIVPLATFIDGETQQQKPYSRGGQGTILPAPNKLMMPSGGFLHLTAERQLLIFWNWIVTVILCLDTTLTVTPSVFTLIPTVQLHCI